MKNLFRYRIFSAIILLLVITSCEDAYEIEPFDQLGEDNTFTNLDELQQGLSGVYARYNLENEITYNSIVSDNTKPGFDNGGQLINLFNFVISPSTGNANAIYNSYYSMINAANRVIEALPDVEPKIEDFQDPVAFQTDLKIFNNIKGQLHALRATAHYHLHTYYTTDYTDPSALSVIISDFVPETNQTFNRNTNQEVVDFIKSELVLAESLLSDDFNDINFVTKDFITGMRARVALLENDPMGIDFADDLINSGSYTLANQSDYELMFQDVNQSEVIFNLARTSNDGLVGGIWYFTNSDGPFIEASNSLYNSFDSDDVRLGVNINLGTDNGGPSDPANNIHLINKYPGSGGTPYQNNIKAMRLSEMYLIKAELQAKAQGDLNGAAQTLKELRDVRFGASTPLASYADAEEAVSDVLSERRKELAFEGFRFLDIKRNKDFLGEGINRLAPLDCPSGNCTLPPSDFRFTLPIPQTEQNAFPGIQQNPGYAGSN
jgi:hypothetical protein